MLDIYPNAVKLGKPPGLDWVRVRFWCSEVILAFEKIHHRRHAGAVVLKASDYGSSVFSRGDMIVLEIAIVLGFAI